MYEITKTFAFSASHQLTHLPATHKCHRLHGHNYRVTVALKRVYLNKEHFVLDYGEMAPFKEMLDREFDHRHLNNLLPDPPTAERLAEYFHRRASDLFGSSLVVWVEVAETENTTARYHHERRSAD